MRGLSENCVNACKTLYNINRVCTLNRMTFRNLTAVLAASVFLTGCSTTVTNLTPHSLPRNPNNVYPLEVEFSTSQKTIREDTLEGTVLFGQESYPMKRTPMLNNRFEAMVPIPASTNYIYYRYKFDYKYNKMPTPGESSRLSPTYQLEIVDR